MGGTVAFTLRTPGGEEYRMLRWTNILPYYVTNMKLCEKDPEHIRETLSTWRDLKADYESGPPYRNNMTEVYAPYDNRQLYPQGYGLVVVDMEKNAILSMQGYTLVGDVRAGTFMLILEALSQDPDVEIPADEEHFTRFMAFAKAGRLKSWLLDTEAGYMAHEVPPLETLMGGLLKVAASRFTSRRPSAGFFLVSDSSFEVDMSPFTVERFPETSEGIRDFKQRVLDLGFELSPEEEQGWADVIREAEEDEV